MEHHTGAGGQLADVAGIGADHVDAVGCGAGDLRPLQNEGAGELVDLRAADPDPRPGRALHELADGTLEDHEAAPDDHQVLGHEGHLREEVARHEHGAALGGEALQEPSHPLDALGVEAVVGLVEEEGVGVAEHRAGQAEPLLHAEREAADPLAGHLAQPDQAQHLVHPAPAQPVGGGDGPQVVAGLAGGMHIGRVQ